MSTRIPRVTLLLATALLAGSCRSGLPASSSHWNTDHWTIDSVPERMMQHFTGYRRDRDGEYVDFQYRKKKDINITLRRHFLGNSPEDPFEPYDPSLTQRRPPHSIAPDPLYYFHAEGVFIGLAMLGITGAFIPIPVDSLIATMNGGWDEFGRGFTEGADAEAESPPGVSKFRVKNH
jgi:hypothetical protein